MKRYRNAKGELTRSIEEIEKETLAEARKYYRLGGIYLNNADKREYVLIENDEILARFKSFEGYNLFIYSGCKFRNIFARCGNPRGGTGFCRIIFC